MTVFTTHTPVAAGHDRFPAAAGRGAPGQDPRSAAPLVRGLHGAGAGLSGRPQRAVLHDRAGAQAVAARQRRQRPARHGLAADVAAAVRQHEPRKTCRSATSPTASTCRAGSPPRCTCSSTVTWGPTGPSISGCPRPGTGSSTVEDAELWETQQVLKARLINFVRNRLASQARRRSEPDAGDRAGHAGARPQRADDRLRPAVRHLQALRA